MTEFNIDLDKQSKASVETLHGHAVMATLQCLREGDYEKATEYYGRVKALESVLTFVKRDGFDYDRFERYQSVSQVVQQANSIEQDESASMGIGVQ